MKLFTAMLFAVLLCTLKSTAQNKAADLETLTNKARFDARRFRRDKTQLSKFKTFNFPTSSDYFKPRALSVSDSTLLRDSVFVNAYRTAAFYNTVNMRWHPGFKDMLNRPKPGHEFLEPTFDSGNQKLAYDDAANFRLSADRYHEFKQETVPNTSDYFKPSAAFTPNAALLSDSAYTAAFRQAAFYKALKQKDGRHALGVVAIVVGGVAVLLTAFILALTNSGFTGTSY